VIFEILQSAAPMHFSRFFGGLALAGGLGLLAQPADPGAGGLPPTAGLKTNVASLTATNFIAGGLGVTNGVLAGPLLNNVPPTSILGSNVVVKPITLGEAIAMALQNNFAVRIARYDPDIAQFNLSGAYAVYEPSVQLSYEHRYNSSPGGFDQQGVPLPSTVIEEDSFAAALAPGMSGYTPIGLRYGINANVSGREFTGGRVGEQFNSGSFINLQQPLLRDFWIDQSRATIQINKKRLRISEWQLRGQLITTVGAVENAYYDLIRARENIKVQRLALDYNNQLLRENKKRVEVGALAPLDEKLAEAEVARGVAALLQTEQSYAVALNNLKNLITQDFANWINIVVDPVETLLAIPAHPDLTESWQRGLTMRPELQQLKFDLEAQNITLKFLKNQMWPALDLTGSYGHVGFDEGRYSRAIDDLTRDDNPSYRYGVVLSIPLGNRRARNDFKSAQATKAQVLLQFKELEQTIMMSIDNAIKLLRSQFQQVEATRQARLFAQDALSAEQKKYENGKSTSFQVLQYQRDLTQSRFEELAALAEYNKALAGLASQEGTTLQRHNLNLNLQ
jgi:outer membrane protein